MINIEAKITASSIIQKSIDHSEKSALDFVHSKEEIKQNDSASIENLEDKFEKESNFISENNIVDSNLDKSLNWIRGTKGDTQIKRKRNKILTLNESRRKLSLRADVMNKNFFRALRREIKFIFDDYLISNGFSTSKCKRTFKSNLKRYTAHLLDSSNIHQMNGKRLFIFAMLYFFIKANCIFRKF